MGQIGRLAKEVDQNQRTGGVTQNQRTGGVTQNQRTEKTIGVAAGGPWRKEKKQMGKAK